MSQTTTNKAELTARLMTLIAGADESGTSLAELARITGASRDQVRRALASVEKEDANTLRGRFALGEDGRLLTVWRSLIVGSD
jgi:hypothetical protein